MLNLLFISNSPKVQHIKSVLQPVLKVIIDVVPDFDHGLKDVFEKRPNTVCIQEQISGVTGESVARHIQMLLGSGAPKFILMHEGSTKVKIIKGLFEHIVDLNQSDDTLAENFQETLKTLLGDQWSKISLAPETPSLTSFLDSEEMVADADKMIDDFLSDLETNNFSYEKTAGNSVAPVYGADLLSNSDEIAEMLVAQAELSKNNDLESLTQRGLSVEPNPEANATIVTKSTSILPEAANQKVCQGDNSLKSEVHLDTNLGKDRKIAPVDSSEAGLPQPQKLKNEAEFKQTTATPVSNVKPVQNRAEAKNEKALPASDLIRKVEQPEDKIPSDLLLAFEKNYRTESSHLKRNILIGSLLAVSVVVSGWFWLNGNSNFISTTKQLFFPSKSVVEVPKQPGVILKQPAAVASRPSFIPTSGQDKSYSVKNPGWERYPGGKYEIRIFKKAEEIKAVQVLSVKGNSISQAYLDSVFKEITGTAEITVSTRTVKSGLTELRGVTGRNADFVIYKKDNSVRAFVLSLN